MDWFQHLGDAYGRWTAVFHVLLVVLATWVARLVAHRIMRRLHQRWSGDPNSWPYAVLVSAEAPLRVGLWVLGASIAFKWVFDGADPSFLADILNPVLVIAGIATVTWFLLRLTAEVERVILYRAEAEQKPVDRMAADAISKLVQGAILLVATLEALRTLGLSLSGLLAFGGIGGVALGFAAQGLMSNFLGGLTVYLSQPFKVGDWVVMPQEDIMGEVKSIGWRATCILALDRRPVYVPNSKFNTAILINHSRMTNRRIREYIHVRYDDIDRVPGIVADIRRFLEEHPGIQQDFIVVNFDTYGDYALKIFIYTFTVTTDYREYMRIKEEVLLKAASIIRAHGARLAVPTSTIHVPGGIQLHGEGPLHGQEAPGALEQAEEAGRGLLR